MNTRDTGTQFDKVNQVRHALQEHLGQLAVELGLTPQEVWQCTIIGSPIFQPAAVSNFGLPTQ